MNETRVGYMTIDVLADMVEEHIRLNTEEKRYVGDIQYLTKYKEMRKFLE